ncbi:uncharacterized protein LOC127838403 [Dreissena polymorpha]|uniref:Uncharacterized protein n=1 Tax=Dreissena polymorpha TaxID=45954 RepID=A0A9D4F6E1_DREPO|nr:uncharacterized protein LOC127838403 [Dreissena polymorpha]XP_052222094.1 uncharacterized protein LOC127838403 [Dreissena polymorpha]KAH3792136.1 hypothetical protein DPMN_145627 [Dreissena polymorpha]
MSVAAIGTSVPRVGPTNSASTGHHKVGDGRPNTGRTGGVYTNIFRAYPKTPQKLPVSRIPDIVERMQRDTRASKAKAKGGQWYKGDDYVDPRSYSWKNLALFSDYQAHMWTQGGDIKKTYKK